MSFSSAAAGELHVFADAVRDIVNRSFDSFLHDDVKLAKTVWNRWRRASTTST